MNEITRYVNKYLFLEIREKNNNDLNGIEEGCEAIVINH